MGTPNVLTQMESNFSGGSVFGTTVTASSTANQKGNYATLIASTAFDSYGVWIVVFDNWSGDSTDNRALLDIAVGPSNSETVVVPNLLSGQRSNGWHSPMGYFPVFIPAGSRISARTQAAVGSRATQVSIWSFGTPAGEAPPTALAIRDIGTNLSTSGGTPVTSGASSAEGSWAALGRVTAGATGAVLIASGGGDTAMTAQGWTVDFASGESGAETPIHSDFYMRTVSTGDYTSPTQPTFHNIGGLYLPSGTQLNARASSFTVAPDAVEAAAYVFETEGPPPHDALRGKTQAYVRVGKPRIISAAAAAGPATFTVTHTWDAVVQKSQTETHTWDAVVQDTLTRTHTFDAVVFKTLTRTHTFDAVVFKTLTRTHTFDAVVFKTLTRTHTWDAVVQKTFTASHTFDVVVYKHPLRPYRAPKPFESTRRLLTSRITKIPFPVLAAGQITHTFDATVSKTLTATHTFDAVVQKTFTVSHTFDAVVQKSSTVAHTFDAVVFKTLTRTHTFDAVVHKTAQVAHTFDAVVWRHPLQPLKGKKPFESASRYLRSRIVKVPFPILGAGTIQHTFDATVFKAVTRTHTFDAVVQKSFTRTHTFDALVLKTLTRTHTFDATIFKTLTRTHTFDAVVQKTLTRTHTYDAVVQKTFTRTHTYDATVFKTLTRTHTFSSVVFKTLTRTHTFDAIAAPPSFGTFTRSHTFDAYIYNPRPQWPQDDGGGWQTWYDQYGDTYHDVYGQTDGEGTQWPQDEDSGW